VSRDRILARIRAAAEGPLAAEGPPAAEEAPVAEGLPDSGAAGPVRPADIVSLFINRSRDVGVEVATVGSPDGAAHFAQTWCAARRVRRAAVWDVPDLALAIARLRAAGVEIIGPGATAREIASADAGITGAEWGIAETATVVLASSPRQPRLTSLLPPAHLMVLRANRLLPDLPALFAACGPLPPALTLVTGPSRSADIGLVPVLGAHGPTEVAVVLVS
jgi:L-lactate dehydrogenase complex protein LldG